MAKAADTGSKRLIRSSARYTTAVNPSIATTFGEIPEEVEAKLEGESVEQLENLMNSALVELTGGIAVSSLDEFVSILSI